MSYIKCLLFLQLSVFTGRLEVALKQVTAGQGIRPTAGGGGCGEDTTEERAGAKVTVADGAESTRA